jgi:hypothetical protein
LRIFDVPLTPIWEAIACSSARRIELRDPEVLRVSVVFVTKDPSPSFAAALDGSTGAAGGRASGTSAGTRETSHQCYDDVG